MDSVLTIWSRTGGVDNNLLLMIPTHSGHVPGLLLVQLCGQASVGKPIHWLVGKTLHWLEMSCPAWLGMEVDSC